MIKVFSRGAGGGEINSDTANSKEKTTIVVNLINISPWRRRVMSLNCEL